MAERRFYWLKLKEDFFESKRIKKLRKMAGGDTYTIIYLKMQLKSIQSDGVLSYTGLEQSFAEELALDLDEDPADVGLLLNYLLSVGLVETNDNINFLLPYAAECIGSEGTSAERVRNFRERKALQCNADVTQVKRIGNVEIEKEIEKDIEIDNSVRKRTFTPPTLEEVQTYCKERGKGVDAERWFNFYQSKGWMVGKNKMKDWKASVRTWEKEAKPEKKEIDYQKIIEEAGWT